jgi:hypothetical protein
MPIYPPCVPGSGSGTSPLQGGDSGLTVLPNKRIGAPSNAQRQSPSLSPRKGRKRGVERHQRQPSIPVPHLPTLSLPLQGGDSGLTVLPNKRIGPPSNAQRQSSSLSPRKGRKRGVERGWRRPSAPLPHLPTLSLPLQGGDLGLTVLPNKRTGPPSRAQRQSPSLSPRKGRKRGVERRWRQLWVPLPHLPTLSLPLQGGDAGPNRLGKEERLCNEASMLPAPESLP